MPEKDKLVNIAMPLGAILAAAALCFIFGANTVAIKISLDGPGVFTVAAIRFGMAGLVILAWALSTGRTLRVPKGMHHHVGIMTLTFFIQLTLFYTGLSRTLASRGTLLANMQPFFVLFLAHFFVPGDTVTVRKIVGILMGFSAVVLVLTDRGGLGTDWHSGDLAVLLAAFTWACNGVYTKRLLERITPVQAVLFPTLFSAPLFLSAALITGESVSGFTPPVLSAILYQGLVATAFGFVAWSHLLKHYGAVSLHAFIFIMPIAGVTLGGLVLNEPISLHLLLALILIVIGILIVNAQPQRQPPLVHPGRHV